MPKVWHLKMLPFANIELPFSFFLKGMPAIIIKMNKSLERSFMYGAQIQRTFTVGKICSKQQHKIKLL